MTTTTPTGKYTYATGKRKCAIAQVRLYKGKGNIIVNGKDIKEYVDTAELIENINFPFKLTGTDKKYDVTVVVSGGGISAQADAIRHGISRGLIAESEDYKPTLKKAGLLTRDARKKERKKFGLKKARKAPQFSKR